MPYAKEKKCTYSHFLKNVSLWRGSKLPTCSVSKKYTHNDASVVLLADYTYDVTKGATCCDDLTCVQQAKVQQCIRVNGTL